MSQPRWPDPQSSPAYGDEPGRYGLPQGRSYDDESYGDDLQTRRVSRGRAHESDRAAPRWGMLPGRFGVFLVIGTAALGAFVSAVTNRAPGVVLGVFLVAGTVIAVLSVRPHRGYLIFPVPALAYLGAALIAGMIYDRGSDGSRTVLAINGTQWIANGFAAMAIATSAAILITIIRWFRHR
jgi:hypothetical protein